MLSTVHLLHYYYSFFNIKVISCADMSNVRVFVRFNVQLLQHKVRSIDANITVYIIAKRR